VEAQSLASTLAVSPEIPVKFGGFVFPITRFPDHRIARFPAALCLRSSATDPTHLDVLLKAKAEPQFERPFKSLSTPLFYVFQGSNRG
jgi:hypothetical protein